MFLSTFLESSLNLLSNGIKKYYKIEYNHGEKRYQSLNCKKHSFKGQSETKYIVATFYTLSMVS